MHWQSRTKFKKQFQEIRQNLIVLENSDICFCVIFNYWCQRLFLEGRLDTGLCPRPFSLFPVLFCNSWDNLYTMYFVISNTALLVANRTYTKILKRFIVWCTRLKIWITFDKLLWWYDTNCKYTEPRTSFEWSNPFPCEIISSKSPCWMMFSSEGIHKNSFHIGLIVLGNAFVFDFWRNELQCNRLKLQQE